MNHGCSSCHQRNPSYTEVSNFYALLETISFTYFVPRLAISNGVPTPQSFLPKHNDGWREELIGWELRMPIYGSLYIVLLRSRLIMWCHLLKFSDPLRSRQGPFVDSGLIVLVTTAQSGHGPFCSLAVLLSSCLYHLTGQSEKGKRSFCVRSQCDVLWLNSRWTTYLGMGLLWYQSEVLSLLLCSWLLADISFSWCLQWKKLSYWCKQCKQWPRITAPLSELCTGVPAVIQFMLALIQHSFS